MKLSLERTDIEEAIRAHLGTMGIALPVSSFDFSQGRGERGLTVEIELGNKSGATMEGTATVTSISDAKSEAETPEAETEAENSSGEEESGKGNSLFGKK